MKIGIDATNIGGGGGITHLVEIISNYDYDNFSDTISKIIIFASDDVLNKIPNFNYIEKFSHSYLNKNILYRFYFQVFKFDYVLDEKCDIVFSLSGDYFGRFKPLVSMSRNMLLYEKDNWKLISNKIELFKFWSSLQKQKLCFRKSTGIIFISNFAKNVVLKELNLFKKDVVVIPHGVSSKFRFNHDQKPIENYNWNTPFKFLYVSTVHVYKHQWNVVQAIYQLRKKGFPVELHLVGGVIYKPAGDKLNKCIEKFDPKNEFVFNHGHVSYDQIQEFYRTSNGIVFASTCENMPNILIESMASGIPIACSDKNPMPEFLGDSKLYFNSHDIISIVNTLEKMLKNPNLRTQESQNNLVKSTSYNWALTSKNTFNYILKIYKES